MGKATDSEALQIAVHSTADYDKFKVLPGNRRINKPHVAELVRSIGERGNLTQLFPIIVNSKMEVVDGQHRLEALKELKLPVYYEIKEDLSDDTVIVLNTANKNWNWKDFMSRHAERGNENYINFKKLVDEFGFGFNLLMSYVQNERTGGHTSSFSHGELRLNDEDYEIVRTRLGMYDDLRNASNEYGHEFAMACLDFFKRPDYNHEQLVERVEKYRRLLLNIYYARDFYYRLNDIYHR